MGAIFDIYAAQAGTVYITADGGQRHPFQKGRLKLIWDDTAQTLRIEDPDNNNVPVLSAASWEDITCNIDDAPQEIDSYNDLVNFVGQNFFFDVSGGGGSITWADNEIGYGITGSVVDSNADFNYNDTKFKVGFSGSNVISVDVDSGYPVIAIGDNNHDFNSTILVLDDSSQYVGIYADSAAIYKTNNFGDTSTGQYILGEITIPGGSSSVGSYNTIFDSDSGDLSLSGVGDLSFLSFSRASALLMRVNEDTSQAYVVVDDNGNAPIIQCLTQDALGDATTTTQNAGGYLVNNSTYNMGMSVTESNVQIGNTGADDLVCVINHSSGIAALGDYYTARNGTVITINDDTQLVKIANVPQYDNDGAAIADGLESGNLYAKTINVGPLQITNLNIIP